MPEIEAMKQILINSHQFEDKNITLLCDHGNYQHPTKKKIKQEVKKLIKYAVPGDVCFLHLATHGSDGGPTGEEPYLYSSDHGNLTGKLRKSNFIFISIYID